MIFDISDERLKNWMESRQTASRTLCSPSHFINLIYETELRERDRENTQQKTKQNKTTRPKQINEKKKKKSGDYKNVIMYKLTYFTNLLHHICTKGKLQCNGKK